MPVTTLPSAWTVCTTFVSIFVSPQSPQHMANTLHVAWHCAQTRARRHSTTKPTMETKRIYNRISCHQRFHSSASICLWASARAASTSWRRFCSCSAPHRCTCVSYISVSNSECLVPARVQVGCTDLIKLCRLNQLAISSSMPLGYKMNCEVHNEFKYRHWVSISSRLLYVPLPNAVKPSAICAKMPVETVPSTSPVPSPQVLSKCCTTSAEHRSCMIFRHNSVCGNGPTLFISVMPANNTSFNLAPVKGTGSAWSFHWSIRTGPASVIFPTRCSIINLYIDGTEGRGEVSDKIVQFQ